MIISALILICELFGSPSVESSIEIASKLVDRPDIAENLHKICRRESRCKEISVHEIDSHLSRKSWGGQVQLKHIDKECQPDGKGKRWATRGAFGLNASAHWKYLPKCYKPEVFDYPLVSAFIAAQKFLKRCDKKRRSERASWCA